MSRRSTRSPAALDDEAFDALYPAAMRVVSRRFWTPVAVAKRAAEIFVERGARRILDVGSGAGKFALVAAGVAPELHIVGVEQRPHLVAIARRAQRSIDSAAQERIRFIEGDATATSWSDFDGFYFFNPFAENLFDEKDRLDDRVELSMKRFALHVLRVEQALRGARSGAVVVTYQGSSGRIPACFDLAHTEPAGADVLRAWVKARDGAEDEGFYIESEGAVTLHEATAAR